MKVVPAFIALSLILVLNVLLLWQHKQALCFAGSYHSLIFRLIILHLHVEKTLFKHGGFRMCMQRTSQKSFATVSIVNS